jgi:hypothetical protein
MNSQYQWLKYQMRILKWNAKSKWCIKEINVCEINWYSYLMKSQYQCHIFNEQSMPVSHI